MKHPVSQHLNFSVIKLSGEIDLSESPDVRKQILAILKKDSNLLVDLSAVEYIDSSGVASLVEGLQTARSKKLTFALLGVSDSAMQVLQLARLETVFTIHETLDDVE